MRTSRNSTALAGRCIRLTVICVLMVMAAFYALGKQGTTEGVMIEPNCELQAQIKRALDAPSEEELHNELEKLQELSGRNNMKLVPQLLYYSKHATDSKGEHGVKEGMSFYVLAGRLGIDKRDIARALIPYLETQDMGLKETIHKLMRGYEGGGPLRAPDFSLYQSIIEGQFRKSERLPYALVRHMYEVAAGTALLAITRASMQAPAPPDQAEWRQIIWAEHLIADVLWKHHQKFLPIDEVPADAAGELKKLATSAHWWARLYAAEIMRQHKAFRRPEIVERLKQDEHPLVRQAIAAFAEPQPAAAPKDRTP